MHFSHINFTITFWTNNQVASVWAGIEKCYLNAATDFHLWATKRGISLGSSGLLIVSWNQSEDSAKCVVCVNVSLRGQLYPTYLPPSLPLPKDTKQKYDQKLSVTRARHANEGAWIMYRQKGEWKGDRPIKHKANNSQSSSSSSCSTRPRCGPVSNFTHVVCVVNSQQQLLHRYIHI